MNYSSNMFRSVIILLLLTGVLVSFTERAKDIYYSASIPRGAVIDSIVVTKSIREMQVYSHKRLLKKYKVCLGLNPLGPKQVKGDYKTPEGLYHISFKNPYSQFHKGLGISYPNQQDIARARSLGKSPGGDVIIHGLPNSARHIGPADYQNDWTWGCIALRNHEVDELFEHVKVGAAILILP